MRIVELSDYSMVIMKDSEDPPWESVGNVYRKAKACGRNIIVDRIQLTVNYLSTSEYIYTAGRLVLFFQDRIPPKFHLNDEIILDVEIDV